MDPRTAEVDHVAGGADHEHVAEALIEDDFGGDAAVGAAEHHRRGPFGLQPDSRGASMLWLGCSGRPATNRSLPSFSAIHA